MDNVSEAEPIQGVGGWLLFFIVTGVLGTIFSLVPGLKELHVIAVEFNDDLPEFANVIYALAGALLLWEIFYCYCLYRIMAVKRNAISLIKKVLIINFAVVITFPLILVMVGSIMIGIPLDAETLAEMYAETIGSIFGSFAYTLIWYKYFSVSVRVKNTWAKFDQIAAPGVTKVIS